MNQRHCFWYLLFWSSVGFYCVWHPIFYVFHVPAFSKSRVPKRTFKTWVHLQVFIFSSNIPKSNTDINTSIHGSILVILFWISMAYLPYPNRSEPSCRWFCCWHVAPLCHVHALRLRIIRREEERIAEQLQIIAEVRYNCVHVRVHTMVPGKDYGSISRSVWQLKIF